MSVNKKVATRIKVDTDTNSLDDLSKNNKNIPGLNDAILKIKDKIEKGSDNAADDLSKELLEYDKLFFDAWNHPYATGYSAQLWNISNEGNRSYFVDNKAVSETGYPYLDALEDGTSKMSAKPFAIHARDLIKSNAERIVKRNMKL